MLADTLEFEVTQEDIDEALRLENMDPFERSKLGVGPVIYRCPIAQTLKRHGHTCDVRHIKNISVDNDRYVGCDRARAVMDLFDDVLSRSLLVPTKITLVSKVSLLLETLALEEEGNDE